jgi:hypothetical protein
MMHGREWLVGATLAMLGAGCSSGSNSPLVGTWAAATTVGTFTGTKTLQVNGDGSLGVTESATSTSCSGSWVTTGYSWAATATAVTFSGTPVCTGSITCGAVSLSCSGSTQALAAGACNYTLSAGDDTLALTGCTGTSDGTFTREN